MLYRKLGKTNEEVSILGFGCMRLPVIDNVRTNINEEEATKMIRYAIDQGVNYIDTAYPYHGDGMKEGGMSEPFVAKALQDGYREKVNIATKLPSWLIQSREDMDKYLDEQLERLDTDVIDFYLVHTINTSNWSTLKECGIDEFLDQAIKDGKIRYAGFSFHDTLDLFKEIVDYYDWSFCQIQYNYLDEHFQAGIEGLEYAANKGLGIIIMEPLKGGNLINGLPDEVMKVINESEPKRTAAEWGLRWIWNNPDVGVVLSGMTLMKHVVENVNIAKEAEPNSLTEKELAIIQEVKNIFNNKVKVPCTGCSYCMPCPAGVNIPKVFTIYNDYFLIDSEDGKKRTKFRYAFWSKKDEHASNCADCGECEEHCPQSIQIREQLKDVTALFE